MASEPGRDAQGLGEGPNRAPPRRWGSLVALCVVGLVVAAPLLYKQAPREMARWHQAAALEHYLDGDFAKARESLTQSLAWRPDNPDAFLLLATWEREGGRYDEALAACEQALAFGASPIRLYLERSQVYQHLGRWEEGLGDWKLLAEEVEDGETNPLVLNGRAYARALANVELDAGMRDIERALQQAGGNAAMLDTRGYLHYRLGNLDAALDDMNKAIEGAEKELAEGATEATQVDRAAADARVAERAQKERRRSLAVLHYHRLLVLEKQMATEAADKDRARIKELGFDAGERLF
ncbi:MAG: tetratricopeptide repeat protein [Pirellulales bacterium]